MDPEELANAVISNNISKVRRILEAHPALLRGSNENGLTMLHVAAVTGRKELVALLLEMGANVNATDNQGNTPLILAVIKSGEGVVELLLAHGADPTARGGTGETALEVVENLIGGISEGETARETAHWRNSRMLLRTHRAKGRASGPVKTPRKASLGCGILTLVVVAIGIVLIIV